VETILIAENDRFQTQCIRAALGREGYRVITARSAESVLGLMDGERADLLIMNTSLPGAGTGLCRTIRERSSIAILLVSASGSEEEMVAGLNQGADDFMFRPFPAEVLLARVRAHLRRRAFLGARQRQPQPQLISYGSVVMDLNERTASLGGRELVLTPLESSLLGRLLKSPETFLASEELFETVWGTSSLGDRRTLYVHLFKLRKKLEEVSAGRYTIASERGRGYRLHVRVPV
jgi:DNA-binding response OmpR family regulator